MAGPPFERMPRGGDHQNQDTDDPYPPVGYPRRVNIRRIRCELESDARVVPWRRNVNRQIPCDISTFPPIFQQMVLPFQISLSGLRCRVDMGLNGGSPTRIEWHGSAGSDDQQRIEKPRLVTDFVDQIQQPVATSSHRLGIEQEHGVGHPARVHHVPRSQPIAASQIFQEGVDQQSRDILRGLTLPADQPFGEPNESAGHLGREMRLAHEPSVSAGQQRNPAGQHHPEQASCRDEHRPQRNPPPEPVSRDLPVDRFRNRPASPHQPLPLSSCRTVLSGSLSSGLRVLSINV